LNTGAAPKVERGNCDQMARSAGRTWVIAGEVS
jgi:hypothetical protein